MGVTHTFNCGIADDPGAAAAGQILPSHWNDTHTVNVDLSAEVTGTLPVANGGTGTTTPSLVAGTNVTITGTWPNQTINASGGGGGVTINTTTITGGTSGRVLYDNAGTVGEKAVTGTGDVVLATSPTLTTPNLGTPSALTLTNATGLPVGGISATGTPSASTYLRGDGSWQSVSASPGGSNTQVQYNNSGSFGGSANFTFSGSTVGIGAAGAATGAVALGGATSGTVTVSAAAAAGTWTLTLPTSAGTNGYVLQTDGSGNTSWVAQSGGGGSPAGSDKQVQFNDGGSFGAEAGFEYNKTTNTLSVEKAALGTAGSALGVLTLSGNTSGTVTIQPAAAAGTYTLTLPTDDGTSGQYLQTDGSGVLSWATVSGGTPGGSSGQLQYNNAGAFGGTSGITTTGTELTIASGTKTASAPTLDITQEWNNAAVTFDALKLNVTNTASAAASNLLNIGVGGGSFASYFAIRRNGNIVLSNATPKIYFLGQETYPNIQHTASTSSGAGQLIIDSRLAANTDSRFVIGRSAAIASQASSLWSGDINNATSSAFFFGAVTTGTAAGNPTGTSSTVAIDSSGLKLANTGSIRWSSLGHAGTYEVSYPSDLFLLRDAANTLAQRNSTNAQTLRVYNTYTSATSYERGKIAWASNVLQIGTEKGSGGGTARALELQTDATTRLTVGASGGVTIADANDVAVGTTTGTKIGTATSQKLGFWNATPIVQPTTAVAAATVAATGIGDVVAASTTFDGYTIPQIVKALRDAGLLA